jgi:hypothetical protein
VYKTSDGYTQQSYYWYYPNSFVVYDYDLHFAVGMVERDENGNPMKINKDVYIIDKAIPIPLIK